MIPFLVSALPIVGKLLDKVIPDPQARDKAKLELMQLAQAGEFKELEAQASVVLAEASSAHKLTAAWRPITMLVFVAIIANNFILYPYLSLFWHEAPVLVLPEAMWDLLKIGIGGYVGGRSLEKVATALGKK